MDVMSAMGLNEIRKPAGTSNAGDSRDLLVPQLAFLDQFEIKRENREIAATGTPGRMIGSDFFFGQTFPVSFRKRRRNDNVAVTRRNVSNRTHLNVCV